MAPADFDHFCQENADVIDELTQKFRDYEPLHGFSRDHLIRWISQFQPQHRYLAIKVAKQIAYYSTDSINSMMATLRNLIDQQIKCESAQPNEVFYIPFGRTGESGEDITRRFRNMNRLHRLRHQFVNKIELQQRVIHTRNPVFVFLDDFVGSGNQVCEYWDETLSQIVSGYVPMYLGIVAAFKDGIDRIEAETKLRVIPVHTLGPNYQIMKSTCRNFDHSEKDTIMRYCKNVDNLPLGFRECGLLVSFAYGTPNNTISIIRGSKRQRPWRGLLPAWEDQ